MEASYARRMITQHIEADKLIQDRFEKSHEKFKQRMNAEKLKEEKSKAVKKCASLIYGHTADLTEEMFLQVIQKVREMRQEDI